MRDLRHLLDTATADDLPDLVTGLRALLDHADEAHIYYYRHPEPSVWNRYAASHLRSIQDALADFTAASRTVYTPPVNDGSHGVGS